MPRVLRFICLGLLVLLLQAGGCDDEPRPRARPSPSATPSSTVTDASPSPSPTSTSTPTPTPTATSTRLSGVAERTGITITRDNQPIDEAGLAVIGWKVDAANGQATWTDPSLGTISVTWEVPDASAIYAFEVSYWGEVTGNNLAMGPVSMSATVFTARGKPETSAHSTGGVKAEAPTARLTITVPDEQPVGTQASVSINLGFPQPVLVTYNYVYL